MTDTGSIVSSNGEAITLANLLDVLPSAPQKQSKAKSAKDIKPADYTKPFMEFIDSSPTVFHAVSYFSKRLEREGFVRLSERDSWKGKLQKGGKYYTTRNGSSIIGFSIPTEYKAGNGVAMAAGHIDALTARLKPVSKKPSTAGYTMLGVAPYAGGMNSTWWDRDLGVGGRVIIKNAQGKIESRLVKLDWPIARISTLAPHFGSAAVGPFNPETQMTPVIGLESSDDDQSGMPVGTFAASQPARLVKAITSEMGIKDYSSIINWELELFEFEPSRLGGLSKELLFAPRIDDKLCSWAALEGLIEASKDLEGRGTINACALFDDEEIGSKLRQGAMGNLLSGTVERIIEAFSEDGKAGANVVNQTYANSFLLSADVTHAVNPNFMNAYLADHAPKLNVGLCVAADPNGHMTTDAVSSALLQRIAEKSGHTLQVFQIRNDSRSGGTVGPMLSAAMGVRAIDAGLAQLSMHSIRATCGSLDPGLGVQIFTGLFEHFEEVDAEFEE
ncbi:aspartyl aminopeptidase [Sphaerosporella brunnea]|uniref:Aspartyl aminopeptidase n=1 Tax=Sphaerosporella brunnea TaxID=1250544 RepID=A0A5J5F6E8_9PEZI|nr:aspartyl aminopeptidase [Sphaerosporella brunnea]